MAATGNCHELPTDDLREARAVAGLTADRARGSEHGLIQGDGEVRHHIVAGQPTYSGAPLRSLDLGRSATPAVCLDGRHGHAQGLLQGWPGVSPGVEDSVVRNNAADRRGSQAGRANRGPGTIASSVSSRSWCPSTQCLALEAEAFDEFVDDLGERVDEEATDVPN